ncbi:hypothetical protein EQG41_18130 [Billgrantia azerbaijanica]|nr:hypothetical protein EQG41_18130 [Halomonas azerbaijanica]
MKERPILFKRPAADVMVRALLDGRKTQARWLLEPQPSHDFGWYPGCGNDGKSLHYANERHWRNGAPMDWCHYGQPGDRLWVRETFADGLCTESTLAFRATHKPSDLDEGWDEPIKWKPPIFMPRSYSRITLEIVSVRVERLQEISEADAEAEGAFFTDYGRRCHHYGPPRDASECPEPDKHHPQRAGWSMVPTESHEQCLSSARMAFANLWESINGAGSWDANPWVWVVEFKRVEQQQEAA